MCEITEDYVSFETAKLLKEKGFNCDEISCIRVFKGHTYKIQGTVIDADEDVTIPTIQLTMKWLRKEHNKIIVPNVCINDPISGKIDYYIVGIWHIPKNNGGSFCYTFPTLSTPYNGYSSYEEACEAGIKYCLENLL